jgi:hypothetical protein
MNNHITRTTAVGTKHATASTVILSLIGILPLTVILHLLLISLILVG